MSVGLKDYEVFAVRVFQGLDEASWWLASTRNRDGAGEAADVAYYGPFTSERAAEQAASDEVERSNGDGQAAWYDYLLEDGGEQ